MEITKNSRILANKFPDNYQNYSNVKLNLKKRIYDDFLAIQNRISDKEKNDVVDLKTSDIINSIENLPLKRHVKLSKNQYLIKYFKEKSKEKNKYDAKNNKFFSQSENKMKINYDDINHVFEPQIGKPLRNNLSKKNSECYETMKIIDRESNKLYSFIEDFNGMKIIEKNYNYQNGICVTNCSEKKNEQNKDEIIHVKLDINKSIDFIAMDVEDNETNKMQIDMTQEEYFTNNEKSFVEKHYEDKNKKILDLFLNGNK